MNFSRPSSDQRPYVIIGNRLFGPKCGLFPLVCYVVVPKVVEVKTPQSYQSVKPEHVHTHGLFPAMFETLPLHHGASRVVVIANQFTRSHDWPGSKCSLSGDKVGGIGPSIVVDWVSKVVSKVLQRTLTGHNGLNKETKH